MKRFPVKGVTRDKEYDLTQGKEHSRILYFSANPNGEAEVIRINLKPKPKLKKANFEYNFSDLAIKNRNANGNILSKHSILKIYLKEKGVSTLGGRKIWFDSSVNRLNADERGVFLGEYSGDDKIIVITRDGKFRFTNYDLSNHFEDNILIIEKFNKDDVYSVIFFDADQNFHYLKRFQLDGLTNGKMQSMVGENPESRMVLLSKELLPHFKVNFGGKNADREPEKISGAEFIALKSFKARGKRLTTFEVKKIIELKPIDPDPETIAKIYGEDFELPSDESDAEEDDLSPLFKGDTKKEEEPPIPDVPLEIVEPRKEDEEKPDINKDKETKKKAEKKPVVKPKAKLVARQAAKPTVKSKKESPATSNVKPTAKKVKTIKKIEPKEDEISLPIELPVDTKPPQKPKKKNPKKDNKSNDSASQMTLEL